MIIGIGLDLIELDRISESVKKNSRFTKRILTENELELYNQLKSDRRKTEFISGRFAAKEAFSKAAGVGIGKLSFQHIEVLPNDQGAPVLTAKGFELTRIFVSITHSKQYAAAQVVIEEREDNK